MTPRVVARFLAAAVVAAGLTACTTGTARPAVPLTDATPGFNDVLVGAWSSTTDDAAHIEGTIPVNPPPELPKPSGWSFFLRTRCVGDGTVSMRVSGKTRRFVQPYESKCIGKWIIEWMHFPPGTATGPYDPGPFSLTIDRSAGVTSWDVEAYAQRTGNVYPNPSASPT
ncbi:hypothetical protein KZZ52_31925 [Dactylosporangium sp. AC04546]|uniref:hypothetical protein n=1 Tax=Dactylosporangium sp. AC04546 TaxID=2862460 RepID=UPI001EDCCFB5|nr:hypothetical protein [Dactylosporangium sp. AC04546]WVK78601.1 hypothetical protein KZZ52_31925 [Dactylosporangium sp. AC04546]